MMRGCTGFSLHFIYSLSPSRWGWEPSYGPRTRHHLSQQVGCFLEGKDCLVVSRWKVFDGSDLRRRGSMFGGCLSRVVFWICSTSTSESGLLAREVMCLYKQIYFQAIVVSSHKDVLYKNIIIPKPLRILL